MYISRVLRRTLQSLRRALDGDDQAVAVAATAQVTVSTTAGRTVVTVAGDLGDASAARLRNTVIDTAVQARPKLLLVDLTRTGQSGGAAVRALADGHRTARIRPIAGSTVGSRWLILRTVTDGAGCSGHGGLLVQDSTGPATSPHAEEP